ncbi:MAG: GspH/FimT family pseudopilin [Oleispira antarctica]|uniref:Type II secretion system protein H n=1 Tax=Oleispira antarctica RB-8 TaxID=698738 RepID=R4YRN3_OLEAN|nr:GspH/FimT family pseudopilin [Oleispira antarctica]MBQ0791183.1 GspH/FimT family pseudopilin [Oleispira antarctica]CCK74769.1 type IV pilus biogenesis protein [Oleispira antarctica RB-8]
MKKHYGFTLIELMVVVAIIGIMVTAGTPVMRTYFSNSASNSAQKQLFINLMQARNQAITRQVAVTIKPNDSKTGGGSLAEEKGVNWGAGWRTFIDASDNPNSATDILLSQQGSLGDNVKIHSTSGTLDSVTPIIFEANGAARNSGTLSIGTYGCIGQHAHTIQINATGQTISSKIDCPTEFMDK